jgi:hypothetical protein
MVVPPIDRPRRLLGRLPDGLLGVLGLWVLIRVTLSLVALFWLGTEQMPGPCHFELALDGWTTFPPLDAHGWAFSLVGVWQRWDACWYTKIAAHGYEPGTSSTAFYPLLPALMRAVGPLTGGDPALAGLLINAAAAIAALYGLWRLVSEDFDAEVADRAVLYLAVFPAAFFLFAPFTEALFLAGAVWALLAARRRTWLLAALAAALAALARPLGVLLVVPLAWEAWLDWRAQGQGPWDWSRRLAPAASLAAPLAATAIFMVWATFQVGQSPLDAQSLWGGQDLHAPWETVAVAIQWSIDKADAIEAVNVVGLLGFAALLVLGLRRLPLSYSLLVLPQLLLVSMRLQPTPLTSTTRYLLVLFPSFVVLALIGEHRTFNRVWLVASTLGLATLTALFIRGDFVA